ncbi:MAG TPA: LysM peptidoglycan-binding domain-containing protein [Thermoanaerobaculia bacterium]
MYKGLEGRSGTCKFTTSDLTAMLTRWKARTFSTDDWKVAECQGTYFEHSVATAESARKPPAKAASKPAATGRSKSAAKSGTTTPAEPSSRPPRELHLVADHWTAWFPPDPATYPPNAKTYTIKGGDTLSGISQQMYGSANLWPQLWESNTWITDAHWIYPGDVLLVQGETSAAAVSTQTTTTATGTEATTGTTGTTAGGRTLTGGQTRAPEQQPQTGGITVAEVHRETPPIPLGAEADVYCYGYIGDPNEPMPNRILRFEDPEVMVDPTDFGGPQVGGAVGDLIFVTGGTATGLAAGETYMVIEPGDLIVHPRTGQVIGQHYNYQGQVKILCAEETSSRAIISQNCREIHLGAKLKPMPQLPIPIARVPDTPGFCDLPTGRSTGYIIDSQDWDLALGQGNLVQVNLGHDDQIQPGDFLTVYRDSDIPGYPRQVLGEIGILTTQSHTATGRIVGMRRAMQVGDSVEAR